MKIDERIFRDLNIYDSEELLILANAIYEELFKRNIKVTTTLKSG